MPFVTSSFLILVTISNEPLVASLLIVAMPFVTSSFLLLVVRPGAPSSVLANSSDALCSLVVRPGAPSSVLANSSDALLLVASCY